MTVILDMPRMLTAIQLNYQLPLETHKINDVWPDWLLAFELRALKPVRTQVVPETLFDISLIVSKLPGFGEQWLDHPLSHAVGEGMGRGHR